MRLGAVRRWSAASRSSRKRTEIFVGGRTDELGAKKKSPPNPRMVPHARSPAAAAQRDDFLSGLPMRAGMASGEARCVGGQSLPCGCSDGPAASQICEGNWKMAEDEPETVQSLLRNEIANNWIVETGLSIAEAREKLPLGIAVGKLNVVFAEGTAPCAK